MITIYFAWQSVLCNTCVFHEILVVLFYVHEGCGGSPEEDWLHDVVWQAGGPIDLVDVLLQEVNAKLLQSRHAFEGRPRKAKKTSKC